MSGPAEYPPPGAQPPPGRLGGAAVPPPGWPGPPPGWSGPLPPPQPPPYLWPPAARQPGAVPLRPLKLGDVLDAAVKIVRHNLGATVGASLAVGALAMTIPVLATTLLWLGTGLSGVLDPLTSTDPPQTSGEIAAMLGVVASWLAGFLVQYLGVVIVTGMIVQVTAAATMGRRMSMSQAWAATAGHRWRLVGLVALLGAFTVLVVTTYVVLSVAVVAAGVVALAVGWFLVTIPLLVVGGVWFWVKITFLAPAVLVAEDVGVIASLARASHLVTGHFWRVLGIGLLVSLITQVVGSIIATPLSVLGVVPPLLGASPEVALLLSVGTQVLSVVLVTAITTPFLAATTALLHLDLRMRKEAYDVELIQRAGLGER